MNAADELAAPAARRRWLKPIERLIDALTDATRRERAILLVLAAYILLWTLYGIIAKASQDMQFDAAELVTWARQPALGYTKHPPLAAWLVGAWFSLFPVRDWTYYLFAMTYAGLGLWMAWRLFGHLLEPGKRVAAFALLTLIPYFNFHGLRFDENAVLGALWAATALCFIRSYETRDGGWAALAGAAAAAAMLGKYWSVFLLAGLALAALTDSRRADYFRSGAPWITVGVGALMLAPHIVWLTTHDFTPLTYAVGAHGEKTLAESLRSAADFLGGAIGYAAVPTLLLWVAARPSGAALRDMLLPKEPRARFIAVAFWTVLLSPAIVSLIFGFELSTLWAMPALILLPPLLLASPLLTLSRKALVAVAAFAVAVPPVMLAASPVIAIAIFRTGAVVPTSANATLLAARIEEEWRKSTDRPLRIVGGDLDVANVTAFYLPERPSAYPVTEPENSPWVTPERFAKEGAVLVCYLYDNGQGGRNCTVSVLVAIDKLAATNPASRRVEVTLTRTFLGMAAAPGHYQITVIPPQP